MDKREHDFISKHLTDLVDSTTCSDEFIALLEQEDVFEENDASNLSSISDERAKIMHLYQLCTIRKHSFSKLLRALEQTSQNEAVAILRKLEPQQKECYTVQAQVEDRQHVADFRFNVRQPVPHFTGRKQELLQLHEKMQKSIDTSMNNRVAIIGLGGIGKSELARQYIQEYGDVYDGNIAWFNGSTNEELKQSLCTFAFEHLKLSVLNRAEKGVSSILEDVYRCIRKQKCLIVIDNAESSDDLLNQLPEKFPNAPHTLITSRNSEFKTKVESLELVGLQEAEALNLVKSFLCIQDNEQNDNIFQLVTKMQCYPLALSQALSYIKERHALGHFEILEYLDNYARNAKSILDGDTTTEQFNAYNKTTFTTWSMTTDLISSDKRNGICAMNILNTISYFQPDGIHPSIFVDFPDGYHDALLLLEKYSMISRNNTDSTISIHRLVQKVTRINLRKKGIAELTLENALKLLSSNINEKNVGHAMSLYKHSRYLKHLCVRYKNTAAKIIQMLIGNRKFFTANYFGQEILSIFSDILVENDDDIIRIKYNLALINYFSGDYENCMQKLQTLLPTFLENQGNCFTNFEVLEAKRYLAIVYRELSWYTESHKLLREIYEERKNIYGLFNWQTIHILLSIAKGLWEVETSKVVRPVNVLNGEEVSTMRCEELVNAVSVLNEAYKNCNHLVGYDTNWTNIIYQTASCFYKLCYFEEAFEIANVVYEKTKNADDKYAIFNIESMNIIGSVLSKQGKHERALEFIKNSYQKFLETLGEAHPNTLRQQINLFSVLKDLGQWQVALDGLRSVLALLKQHHPHHPNVFFAEFEIACNLYELKHYEESKLLLYELKKKISNRFGKDYQLLKCVDYQIHTYNTNI